MKSKKVVKHLKEDIKTFKKEASEDRKLIKEIKGSKMAKKQGFNDKLDEKLGAKNGKKKQSLKDRRDESKGLEKAMGKRAYSSVKSMDKKKKK